MNSLQDLRENRYNLITSLKAESENYTVDIMPSWAEATLEKVKRKGYLNGDGEDGYGLTKSMIRLLVIMDNAGCFGD